MILNTARFNFIANALNGTGGFQPQVSDAVIGTVPQLTGESYLIPYPRETVDKFARRNQVAWYVNDLKATCQRFAGYLSKHRPQRTLSTEQTQLFANDCDWKGSHLDIFWGSFTKEAKARGNLLLLIDMPQANTDQERIVPYLEIIKPEQVTFIDLTHKGEIATIEISNNNKIYGWDSTKWWIKDKNNEQSGTHNLGICPVLIFSESNFPLEGEFSQIADLSKRLFNLRSELDEILRAQTFSLLSYPISAENWGSIDLTAIATQISTNNMLIHTGTGLADPKFIAPPDGPAKIYLETIAAIEEKIRRIGHMIEAPNNTESGIALTIRFQQLNASLSDWATRMEGLERRMWVVVGKWLGLQDTQVSVSWNKDYALTDIATELGVLGNMQATNFSDAALVAKRQQILALNMGSLPDEQLSVLLEAENERIQRTADTNVDTTGKENL